ncbi:G5 domain-containing protein [Staphylococcus simulans]
MPAESQPAAESQPTTEAPTTETAPSTGTETTPAEQTPATEAPAGESSAGTSEPTPDTAAPTQESNSTTTKTPATETNSNTTAPSTSNDISQSSSEPAEPGTSSPTNTTSSLDTSSLSNVAEAPTSSEGTTSQSQTSEAAITPTATPAPTLSQDLSQTLESSTDKEAALTDYLATQDNLSPDTAQQVVDGMAVDVNDATNEEIAGALLTSYLINTSNAPGSDPIGETPMTTTSTAPTTVSSTTVSPTFRMMSFAAFAAPAPATQVSTWDQLVAALNDKTVSNIQLTSNITGTSSPTLQTSTGRSVTIDGGGYTLNSGNYIINAPATSGSWDLTVKNATINTNNTNGLITFGASTTTANTITFENVTHTGSNLINNTAANQNVTVNINGNFSSISSDSATTRANIGAKNINIAPNATVTMTRTGLGSALHVSDGGKIQTGTNSKVTMNVSPSNPWGTTNGTTAFQVGNGGSLIVGDGSTFNITGQNIFNFGNDGTFYTGANSTINVSQKGNGNIVNMGTGSTFEVGQYSKFIAYSDGHRAGDYSTNNLIGLDGNSQILIDEYATLFLDAKNHQWNPDTKTQVGAYNDLVNINATGTQSALLWVKDNATLDLRTDNRDYYAEVLSIPLGGTSQNRQFIFDNANYINFQKNSIVTSGQSVNGSKPNLIYMDPNSPGYMQWNGSYIVKTWNATHFSDPNQSADADTVWSDVVDLQAAQKGFSTGAPTYNTAESTSASSTPSGTSSKDLSTLNLNTIQRIVLISNNSVNPEAVPAQTTVETIQPTTSYQANPDATQPLGTETIVVQGVPGSQTVTTEPGKDTIINVTQPATNEVVGVNNVQATTTTIPYTTQYVGVNEPTDYTNVQTQGQAGSTTTTTTYTVDPTTGQLSNPVTTTQTTQPVTQVIEKGTVQVTTDDVPYNTIYVENPDLPTGTQNIVQQGVLGETQTTTTYTVNATTGALENPTSTTTTLTQKQDQIIEVGSGVTTSTTSSIPPTTSYVADPNPDAGVGDQTIATPGVPGESTTVKEPGQDAVTTVTTPPVNEVIAVDNVDTNVTSVPYNTVYRYNPDLAVGTPSTLVQEGQNGSTTVTTTYDVDSTTGALSNPQSVTSTINPVDQVYEYGPVAGDTVYQADPNLPAGQTTTVPGTPGDPNDPNNQPTDTIIYVGNVSTTETPIIHNTEYIGVNESTTYRNVVSEGSDGLITTTTTYDVDPATGELINPQTSKTTVPAETRVIEKGTVQVTTNDVPYNTVYQENPDLPQGTENVIQQGVVGETQTTTTYTINSSTGELENPTSNTITLVQEQDRIIEVGTGTTSVTTTPIAPTTTYQPNPDKDSGTGDQIVIVQGQDGVATTTKEPGQDAVTVTTTPPVNEVIGVDNVDSATAPIPYEPINRYNPTLPVGSENVVVQEGQNGTATTIKTYEVDPNTGALSNPVTTEEVSPATPRIVEYGPVAGDTVYQADPNLPYNQTTTVPGTPGDPNDPNNLPTDTIIYVGNVSTSDQTLPYDTQYVGVNQSVDYTNVQTAGQNGTTTTTTTYEVDPNTGTLINPKVATQTTPPVTEVIEKGTVQVTTAPVAYDTIYQENPDLPVGVQNELQAGITGETTTTTTYTVNPETGALENPTSADTATIAKQDRIVEVGTGTTVVTTAPIAPTTSYVADPNPDAGAGDQTVVTPGTPGEATTTKEPGQDPVTEVTTPPVNEVISVDNVDTATSTQSFDTITRYNPNLPVGSTNVIAQQGQDGVTTTTTTYDVDPNTGQLSNPQISTQTTPPVTQIVEYGPVAGDTVYQADPSLPYNQTTTIEGTPGDPNDPNNLPTDTIIKVGNTTHEVAPIPYDVEYVGVSQPTDYTNVRTEGQAGSTATTTTYDVDPNTGALSNPVTTLQTVPPITQVVEKGTVQVTTDTVAYDTIYKENPDLPEGTQNVVQQGVTGQTQTTTTYTVNPETGALENPTSDTVTTQYKQDQIIEVGTGVTTSTTSPILPETIYQANPDADAGTGDLTVLVPGQEGVATTVKEPGKEAVTTTTTEPVNEVIGVDNVDTTTSTQSFDTITRYNPNLPVGSTNVIVQQGQDGVTTTTTVYDVDPNTGQLSNPQVSTTTTPPVSQIVEYGPVAGGTVYQPDANVPYNQTQTVEGTPGDPNDPNNLPTDTIIKVGNVQTDVTQQPYDTTYVGVNEPTTYTNVQTQGQDGTTITTTTYTVNPETGALSNPVEAVTTIPPVTQVVEKGTVQVATTDVPYETVYKENPDLPVGTQNEIQAGIVGQTQTTTTYTVNPETGALENPVDTTTTLVEKQDQIIEVGTGVTTSTTTPIPPSTTYQANPDTDAGVGDQTIVTQGQPGVSTTVKEPGQPAVTTTTTEPVTEVIGVDNVDVAEQPIPFNTIERYNPNLPVGTTNAVAQEGQNGVTTTTTTYEVDPNTGALLNPVVETTQTAPTDRIIEYGPVAGEIIYQPDPSLPIGQTTTTEGTPGDPNDPNNLPADTIVNVGNVDTATTVLPHDTQYVGVTQPTGYTNVQTAGIDGATTTTTTYTVDPATGTLSNPVAASTTTEPVTEVVEIGTQQVTTSDVPYTTIYRENPDLAQGTQNEIQAGIIGQTQTTTTYSVNPETGALYNPIANTVTLTEKQDRIVEVGTGVTVTETTVIPPQTVYEAAPNPDPGAGDTTVITPGAAGESTTVKEPGQDAVTTVTTPPVNEVIGVDNVDTQTTTLPFDTQYVAVDQPIGYENVATTGQNGTTTTTTTYQVDPNTGALIYPTTTTATTEPVTQVIEIGTKQVTVNDIQYDTIYRDNPNLPVGTENEVQAGVVGHEEVTTTYSVNPTTGLLENGVSVTTTLVEKQDRIIERGTGVTTTQTTEIPPKTVYVADPDSDAGIGGTTVLTPGQAGSQTVTTKPGQAPVTQTTPAVDQVVGVDNVDINTTTVPYDTRYVGVNEAVGYENVLTPGQDGTTTTTTTYEVNPDTGELVNPQTATSNTPGTTQVIEVGTTQVTTDEVNFETIYVENPDLPQGTQNEVQAGIVGQTQTTTTYTVNPETGVLSNPTTNTVTTKEAQNRIIEVGTGVTTSTTTPIAPTTSYQPQPDVTQPIGEQTVITQGVPGESTTTKAPGQPAETVVTTQPVNEVIGVNNVTQTETEIAYDTIERYNPNLPTGTTNYIAQAGQNGSTVETTTYEVDPNTGALSNLTTQTHTIDPVTQIVEYGPVAGGTIYQPDSTLPAGQTSTVPGTPGDPNDPNNLPTDTVVKVGNVTTETSPVPYNTQYVAVDQPTTYTNVQTPGVNGSTTTTTTYEVDPKTGALQNPVTTTTTSPATTQVIEKGTIQIATTDIAYDTVYRENPDLPVGTQNEIQAGIVGTTQTTTTYQVNAGTGALENSTSETTVLQSAQTRIIEVGVGTTTTTTNEIPPSTNYVANPNTDPGAGDHTVLTPGVAGESTTTKVPGQDPVTEVTTPAVDEVIGVDNVDTQTTTQPYDTIVRYNPDLPVGTVNQVVQEGQNGTTTITTTYEVDATTGTLYNPQTTESTTAPVNRIIEYGPVEGTVVYQPDTSLPYGETETIPGTPGDPNDPNNPPTETVVKVGNQMTESSVLPFDTQYVPVTEAVGYENVKVAGQEGTTTTTTVYDVDPQTGALLNPIVTTNTTPAVTQVVEKGTTQVATSDLPYETVYVENPNLPEGTQNELQAGSVGTTQTTTVYTLNQDTGALENPTSTTVTTQEAKQRIIEVGTGVTTSTKTPIAPTTSYEANPDVTQPIGEQTVTVPGQAGETTTTKVPGQEAVTEVTLPVVNEIIGVNNVERSETEVPYDTIIRYNPSLPVGTTDYVAQEGQNGTVTTTTTYEVDPETGALLNPTTQTTTIDAVNRIVEYGPVAGGIVYQPDATLPAGQTTTVPGQPGDPNDPDNLPTDTIVKVGNVTTDTEQVPYSTTYTGAAQPTTYTNVATPGQTGTTTTTTTYTVNPSTGALSNPQITTTTTPPVNEVVEKGTIQVATTDNPYNVIYRENPDLPVGTQNEIQPGIAGLTETTTTYTVNPQTGELEHPITTDKVLTETQDQIIEIGGGTTATTTTEIPPETTYVANPDPNAGTGETNVVTPGVPGVSTTTKEPGKTAVTEITTPAVNEVIGVDNVDTTTQTVPYDTIVRYNPNLPVGTTDHVAQEGQNGTITTTTTYEVDPETGALSNPQSETTTVNPTQRIVEYGPVAGGTVYQPDTSLPYGETETIPGTPGDPNDPNNPPTETIVKVGNMATESEPIAYDTQYVPSDQAVGYENVVTPGQDGILTTTTTYEVDPVTGALINPDVTSSKVPPVTQVVEKGTTQTTTNDVPFETIYRENPDLPQGTQNEIQAGVTGQTTTTVTYVINSQTGALENPTEVTTTDIAKQDRIIEVGVGTTTSTTSPIAPDTTYEAHPDPSQPLGTQTVTTPGQPGIETTTKAPGQDAVTEVTTPAVDEVIGVNNVEQTTTVVPYDTIERYNPNLPVGTTNHVAQDGQNGSTTTTTTYEVDPETGALINPTTQTTTKDPVQRIVEYGPVAGDVVYQPDPSLPVGQTTTTEGTPGDPNDPNNPPTDTIVHVGNVATDTTAVPYDTEYIGTDAQIGYENVVTPGQDGTTTTTTTYEVDPVTGALINPTTQTSTNAPTTQVIAKGTTQTTTNDVPFETIYVENPDLPQGAQNEIQAGVTGQTETTTTYTVNPETGILENPVSNTTTRTPAQNRIIEIGVGTTSTVTTEIPPETTYEPKPDLSQPIGTQTVTTPGQPGIETTTKAPGKEAVTEITTPPVNEVIGINNVEQTTTAIPFETEVRYNPNLPVGTVNHVAQEGQTGTSQTTTTYEVDPTTGALINPTTKETITQTPVNRIVEYGPVAPSVTYKPNPDLPVGETQVIEEGTPGDPNDPNNLPKDRVISVGTKVVVVEDIPFETIYRDNPNLPVGTEYEVQIGKTGQKQTTTVYGVDPKTGELINPDTTSIIVIEKTDRIIERGTGAVPEQPEEPGTPEQPEEPGTPEQPEEPSTPEPPEEPSTPQQPEVPSTPEQPSAPSVTPPSESEGTIDTPKVPTEPQTTEQRTEVQEGHVEKEGTPSKDDRKVKSKGAGSVIVKAKDKVLPDTGQDDVKKTLFGTLFSGLGAWLLFGKRRKKDNKDQ